MVPPISKCPADGNVHAWIRVSGGGVAVQTQYAEHADCKTIAKEDGGYGDKYKSLLMEAFVENYLFADATLNDIGKAAYRASFDSDIESDDEKIKKSSAAAGKAARNTLKNWRNTMPPKVAIFVSSS